MNQVIRVNATDKRIGYAGSWKLVNTTMQTSSTSSIYFIFRGTGIKVYGRTLSIFAQGGINWALDSNDTNTQVSGSTNGSDISPMYHADNMEDGDHQFQAFLTVTQEGVEIDYFEIENSSGDGFDLLSDGPSAQNVPAQATIVDNFSPEITYHNESMWIHDSNVLAFYGRTASYANTVGNSLSYSFNGAAIWYYGDLGPNSGFFNVSIDGSTPQRLNAENDNHISQHQQLIWSNVSLGPGRHNLTITHDDPRVGKTLSLDFFRVLPETDLSTTSPDVLPTDVQPIAPANQSQTNRVPLAVGLTLGLLALIVGALGSVCYKYRRRGRDLGAPPVSPYAAPPVRQTDLQSRLPQGGKLPAQLAPLSGAPVDMGNPPMYSHGSELGPPPSYEPPAMNGRRVSVAQLSKSTTLNVFMDR